MSVVTLDRVIVEGHTSRGFEAVREAFAENFTQRGGWAARVVPIATEKRLSICGAVSATSRRASRGTRTQWSSCTRRPRGWPQ